MSIFTNKNIFSLISESISEGIMVIDSTYKVISINSTLLSMFEYSEEELINNDFYKLIPENYHSKHDKYVSDYYTTASKRKMAGGRQLWGVKKSGQKIPIKIGLNPFFYEGKKYIVAIIIDVSSSMEYEKKITQLNQNLESKIKERTKNLQDLVKVLEKEILHRKDIEEKLKKSLIKEKELNDLKSEFLTLVTHEFKTPLSNILISSTLASKYKKNEEQSIRDKHIIDIQTKVKFLTNILNDFLSIEKLEAGENQYNLSEFDVIFLTNQCVKESETSLLEGQKIKITSFLKNSNLYFDQKIFKLIITNLLSNAIKYSPKNATIIVNLNRSDKFILLRVIDSGYGIPEQDQKHIFSRYYRGKNGMITHGTGIGLYMIKKHINNLKGAIHFNSNVDVGSEFLVKLPTTL
ncbi:PAS domain S-box protein [Joostella atrarenae]|uniref:histidine kinase n=1 Tax=Joostella atrarenae TaxID=679257 RepID=A0ABS9J7N9_9FLAO|nr:PAS domain-containing sensor histidine kinase [Joostella atrarenae]MCF8716447.1 PAS domain S-box protein [Joostella atrarenae]